MPVKMNLKTKMLISYTIPLFLYMLMVGLVYSTANQVFKTFEEVERLQKVLVLANKMETEAKAMIRNYRGYVIDNNDEFINEYQQNLKATREAAVLLEETVKAKEQKTRISQMLDLVKEYDNFARNSINFINQGKQNQAIALFKTGQGTKFANKFDEVSQEFREFQQEQLEEKTVESKNALNFLLSALIVGSLLLIILAITVALILSSGITNTINQAVSSIASSSTQIAATVEQQERTAAQQASSVYQTTTTMDELGASSRHAAQQAELSAESARQVLKLAESASAGAHQVLNRAEEGNKSVTQTLEGIYALKENVGAIAEQIMRLSQQANQIGSITNAVTQLANQTNMLAINAAVEAVRAGEQGKGFGVVAAEIRKLADQSKISADKINVLIDEIQKAINFTVIVTDQGTKKAEEGIKLSQGTVEVFTSVTQAINDIVLNNQQVSLNAINEVVESCQQISLTSKQQAVAVQQVVEAMNAINQGASETASGISQTKIGTQKLNEAALHLKTVI